MIAETISPAVRTDRVNIALACADDYQEAGRLFPDSKIVFGRRGEKVKAVAAYRTLRKDFYIHHFWADGGDTEFYDEQVVSALCLWLRKEATKLGYDGADFQVMSEQAPLVAFLQMHCRALPVAFFGFFPPILTRR